MFIYFGKYRFMFELDSFTSSCQKDMKSFFSPFPESNSNQALSFSSLCIALILDMRSIHTPNKYLNTRLESRRIHQDQLIGTQTHRWHDYNRRESSISQQSECQLIWQIL